MEDKSFFLSNGLSLSNQMFFIKCLAVPVNRLCILGLQCGIAHNQSRVVTSVHCSVTHTSVPVMPGPQHLFGSKSLVPLLCVYDWFLEEKVNQILKNQFCLSLSQENILCTLNSLCMMHAL